MAVSTEVKITFQMPPWRKYADMLWMTLPGLLAATMQTQRAMIFDKEGAYNGRPGWEPLKCRVGQILKDTGTLSRSIGPRNNGKTPKEKKGTIIRLGNEIVTIGTNIAYAAIHNEGGVIVPNSKQALKFRCKKFRKWVITKKVTIPARTFNDITPQDEDEIKQTIENYLSAVMRGKVMRGKS